MDEPLETFAPVYLIGKGLQEGPPCHPLILSADILIGTAADLEPFHNRPVEKVPIGKNIPALLGRIAENSRKGKTQAVLCSGDPLYFSLGGRIAAYLRNLHPNRTGTDPAGSTFPVRAVPATASLQAAAALLGMAWESFLSVSLHGRESWLELAQALPLSRPVCILTDERSGPATLARFLEERGYGHLVMHVLENITIEPLGGFPAAEAIHRVTVEEARSWEPAGPAQRVIVLTSDESARDGGSGAFTGFGLPDDLIRRDGDVLSKWPTRAAGLASLGIASNDSVWDLGSGSGAVAIEASRLAWRGQVVAVERKQSRCSHILHNRKRFRAANLEVVQAGIGEFLLAQQSRLQSGSASLAGSEPDQAENSTLAGLHLPGCGQSAPARRPDRIFIGGGLGASDGEDGANRLLRLAWNLLRPGGRLVAHCVLLGTLERTRRILAELGAEVNVYTLQAAKSAPLAGDLHFEAYNPIFLLRADKMEKS